jgi:hypothetical protein
MKTLEKSKQPSVAAKEPLLYFEMKESTGVIGLSLYEIIEIVSFVSL